MLKNKAGIWKSVDSWNFTTHDNDSIYINNTSKSKVLEARSDGKVIQEVFADGKAEQLWKKGNSAEGYFTIENSVFPKVITAIYESGLEIKGNNSEMDITRGWCIKFATGLNKIISIVQKV